MKALEDFIDGATFLVVDDEFTNVCLVEETLAEEGWTHVVSTTDSRDVVDLYREHQPDLILLDLMMPHLSGFEVLGKLHERIPPDELLPVIILTADVTRETRHRALRSGARDFLTKPLDPDELVGRCRNLLEMRYLHQGLRRRTEQLENRVDESEAHLDHTLEELERSQRLAFYQERLHTFGELAGGMIHDFNNCLAILQGYSDVLQMDGMLSQRETALEMLAHMSTAAQDAANVVSRLRHFYQPEDAEDQMTSADLKVLLEEAVDLSRMKLAAKSAGARGDIDIALHADTMPAVLCNPSQIREVLINMIFNAIDAMPEGGTITLSSHRRDSSALIEVADTGAGMTEDVVQKCLHPFFSTKGEAGTGLGLAMVNRIVTSHGGRLDVRSTPGEGATFSIELPFAGEEALERQRLSRHLDRELRILFAEDNESVNRVVTRFLRADGHTVDAAGDGGEAMQLFAERSYDLVVTDLSMPRVSGETLAAHVKKNSPGTPVIMVTGFDALMLPGGKPPTGVDSIHSKPISRRELSLAICDVMLRGETATAPPGQTADR